MTHLTHFPSHNRQNSCRRRERSLSAKRMEQFRSFSSRRTAIDWRLSRNTSPTMVASQSWFSSRITAGFSRVRAIRPSALTAVRRATKSADTCSKLGVRQWNLIICRSMSLSVTLLDRLQCWSCNNRAQAWWQCWKVTRAVFVVFSGRRDRNSCLAEVQTIRWSFGIWADDVVRPMSCKDIRTRWTH